MTSRHRRAALVGAVGVLLVAGSAPCARAAYEEVEVANPGRIVGVVRLASGTPKLEPLRVGKDAAVCGASQPSPRLVVGPRGGVANALVQLDGIDRGKALPRGARATIAQRHCAYEPHVLAVTTGTALEIVNADPVLHNVHGTATAGRATLFNLAQPLQGQRTPLGADATAKPGLFELSCESGHPWMSGYLLVSEHPYAAVTGPDGSFALDGVPPGTYRLRLWHEGVKVVRRLESLERIEYEPPYEAVRDVTVPAGGEARVELELELR